MGWGFGMNYGFNGLFRMTKPTWYIELQIALTSIAICSISANVARELNPRVIVDDLVENG